LREPDKQKPATLQAFSFFRSGGVSGNIRALVVSLQFIAPAKHILRQKKPTRVGFFVESLPA
jgi:hypothetical protein